MMGFGRQLTSFAARSAFRRGHLPSLLPTKSAIRSVSNGMIQRVSSCVSVRAFQMERFLGQVPPTRTKLNMERMCSIERVGSAVVFFHRGRCLGSGHSISERLGSAEGRWIHSNAFDSDWRRSVEKASSWSSMLSLEKSMRIQVTAEEYTGFVEACERRLVELHSAEVLSADDLLFVVQRQCGEWQALDLAVGCASRLAKEEMISGGCFPLEKMGEFLHAVSRHARHAKVRCERLQPIISIAEENIGNVLSKCILNVLYHAAHIKSRDLSLYKLMVNVERW